MKNRFLILAMVAGVGLTIQLSALLPLNGASPKSIFAYLAVTPTQKGKTIWLEPVSEKDYLSVK